MNKIYIENYKVKENLGFKNIDIEFENKNNNLILFTGISGVGKSVFMNSLLSIFGLSNVNSKQIEVLINNDLIFNNNFNITKNEDVIIKAIKKEKVRFLLNNQNISKKEIIKFSNNFIKHLNLKDLTDFDSNKLITTIDNFKIKKDKEYEKLLISYREIYKNQNEIRKEIELQKKIKKDIELQKEFLTFEINNIEKVNPNIEEYEKLIEIKNKIENKEYIKESIVNAEMALEKMEDINVFLNQINVELPIVDEVVNEVQKQIDKTRDSFIEMTDNEISEMFDKIKNIKKLINKYEKIENINKVLKEKKEELKRFENIDTYLEELNIKLKKIENVIKNTINEITNERKKIIKDFEIEINKYTKKLFLKDIEVKLKKQESIDINGQDKIEILLDKNLIKDISSGEFNRLRLSLLTVQAKYNNNSGGILLLDEIDANLSGKESESIGVLLLELSKKYQIFAISHQPQLTSKASQHFVIEKNKDNVSTIKELKTKKEKVKEIARMISGDKITESAKKFAENLF